MTTTQKTYCRICEAACGLIADLDANGELLRLRPDKDHPVSQGYMCAKGTRFAETAVHPRRLRHPHLRQPDGSYQQISWDEANQWMRDKMGPILSRFGPHAIGVYYGNPILYNALGLVSLLNFNRVLGTRNVFSSFSQDCNNKFAGAKIIHGGELIQPIPDLERADLALIFGMNPAVSQGSFVHLEGGGSAFERFTRRGGRVVWIDPRRNESAQRWGEHLPIRPGTDVYLLLALLHELRDLVQPDDRVTGLVQLLALAAAYPAERASTLTHVPVNQIIGLAQSIRTAAATTFHLSVGVNMGPFGTLSVVAMQALAYLSGNFDQPGGLLFHPLGPTLSRLLHKLAIGADPQPSRIAGLTAMFDELPGGVLADEILAPGVEQIRALLVVGGNPAVSIPDSTRVQRALASLEVLVHIDLFANESSQTADLLLPSASWLERWDVATTTAVFQQTSLLQYAGPVVDPPGEARSERQILADLSLIFDKPLWRHRRLAKWWGRANLDKFLTGLLNIVTGPYRWRQNGAFGLPTPRPKAGHYLGRGPVTADKRVHFWDEQLNLEKRRLQDHADQLLPLYAQGQFLLIGRRRRLGHNSWLHGALPDGDPEAAVWLAPDDALRLEIEKGDWVRISGNGASIRLPAIPKEEVMPGIVVIPHGLPGISVNTLFPSGADWVEPLSGNHWMTGIPVQVEVETAVFAKA